MLKAEHRVTVAGLGYVGLSNAVFFARNNCVVGIDVVEEKIDKLNRKISTIEDPEIQMYLEEKELNFIGTTDPEKAYTDAEYILVCAPTNYDENTKEFDTSAVEGVIRKILEYNDSGIIIIKSTLPIGFTADIRKKYNCKRILYSPEFLREGKALHDNLYPSRIVIGVPDTCDEIQDRIDTYVDLLRQAVNKEKVDILLTGFREAESIKLFSNTYLAMRVSFFNELDTFAMEKNLNVRQIIEGVCTDPRIGLTYNNPSFGYGGYCLPKDTKQLLSNYGEIPEKIISSIVMANSVRKNYITHKIMEFMEKTDPDHKNAIGIYRLTMKAGSDNFRQSAVHDIMESLRKYGYTVIVYEPTIMDNTYNGYLVFHDFQTFERESDIIIANRYSNELANVMHKVFTRDLYERD